MGMEAFAKYFKAENDGAPATQLTSIYEDLKSNFTDLPSARSKAEMKDALQTYESAHPELCTLIRSEDQFYGFSKAKNLLQKYVQWVCVPAVKDATTEQLEARNTALKTLLERTVRAKTPLKEPLDKLRIETEEKYQKILKEHDQALKAISESLSSKIRDWAHPDASLKVQWHDESPKYVNIAEPLAQVIAGEGRFQGSLSSFGHGFQRSFLLALLQELATAGSMTGPKLLLACEEPELYQHPPQARHLASVLERLSSADSQVIVSTHSPLFIPGRGFEDVRLFRPRPEVKQSNIHSVTFEELAKTIAQATGDQPPRVGGLRLKVQQALTPSLNEMFFASTLILVEGPEDAAYIRSYLALMDLWEDFRRLGCHIVQTDGKPSMLQPLAIAKMLGIPTYVVFDGDKNKQEERDRKINIALMRLCGIEQEDPFPEKALRAKGINVWPNNISSSIIEDIGHEKWSTAISQVRMELGIDATQLQKNAPFIGYVLTELWEQGFRSTVLCDLCKGIIDFAGHAKGPVEQRTSGRAV